MTLAAAGVAAFRGERLVLHDVAFSVAPGGAVLLVGPNGAGKSTLLRLLAGLSRPDAGAIIWDGADIAGDRPAHAARLRHVGHLDAVKPGLTAAQNLAFFARITGGDAGAALEAVGLGPMAAIPARMLSAGQKRRLALARLALGPAALWLLDEPTLGLDRDSVARLGGLLATHRAGGGIVVAATHLPLPLPGAVELRLG